MPQRKVSYKFGTDAVAKFFSIDGHGGLLEPVIAQGVTEFFDAGIDFRRPFERDWLYNVMFCAGYHWMEWRPLQMLWQLRDRVPSWRQRMTENRTLRLREAMAAALFGRSPQFEVIAGSWDQTDRVKAEIGSKALDAYWENASCGEVLEEVVDTALTCGICGISTNWNPDKGPLGPVPKLDKQGVPVKDEFDTPQYEEEADKPGIPKEGTLGAIEDVIWHPWDFIPDPLATKPGELQKILRHTWRTMLYIEERWPDKAGEVQAEAGNVDPYTAFMLNDYYSYRSAGGSDKGDWANKEQGARVLEFIIRPCKTFPRGAMAHVAGKVVLDFVDELDDDLVHSQDIPGTTGMGVEFMSCYPVLGRFWPISLVDVIAPVNKSLDRLVSALLEIASLHGAPKWGVPRQANCKSGAFTKGPNEVVEYQYPFRPERYAPPPMPSYFLKAIDRGPLAMQELAGRHQSSLGQTPTTIRAASAIALVQEQDDVNSVRQARSLERLISRWGRRTMGLMRDHYTQQRFRHLVGNETWPGDVSDFDSADLHSFQDVRVKAGSTLRRNKAAQRAQISELLSGAVGPALVQLPGEERGATLARLLKAMELGDFGVVYDKTNLHRAKAREENRMMAAGQLPPVVPEENPFVHMEEHEEWILSFPVQSGDPQVLARGRAHLQATRQECIIRMGEEMGAEPPPGPGGSKGHAQPHKPPAGHPQPGSHLPGHAQNPELTAQGMLPAPRAPAGAPGEASQ